MNDWVERYVQQVGHYLPRHERADIEAELRSQIQDQLDDQFGGAPTDAEVALVLAELGHPRQMAVSYNSQQYLVGPEIYPTMMSVLRQGWLVVPSVVLFLQLFGALISPDSTPFGTWLLNVLLSAGQALLLFSAVVVLFCAVIQHYGDAIDDAQPPFKPEDLPKLNDPATVDRTEAIFGSAFGAFAVVVMLYYVQVGGLTLRFGNPTDLLPVPIIPLVLLIGIVTSIVAINLTVLRRNRWTPQLWALETVIETVGTICLYAVLYKPLIDRVLDANATLASLPFSHNLPEIIVVVTAVTTIIARGSRFVRLWDAQTSASPLRNNPTVQ